MALPGPPGYVPVGSLVWYFGATPPLGYLVCDGSVVPQSEYPALFQVLGTTYGPADPVNFTLPNLLGSFVRGWNNGGSGPDTGRIFGSHQFQSTAAPTTNVNISSQTESAGAHVHTLQMPTIGYLGTQYNDQKEAIAVPTSQQTSQGRRNNGTIDMVNPYSQTGTPVVENGNHFHTINAAATITGGDPETRPYNIALLPCVKF